MVFRIIAISIVALSLIKSIKERKWLAWDTVGYVCYLLAQCIDFITNIINVDANIAIVSLEILSIALILFNILVSFIKCFDSED